MRHRTLRALKLDIAAPVMDEAPAFSLRLPDTAPADFHTPVRRICVTRPAVRGAAAFSTHDLIVTLGELPVDLAAPLLSSSLPALDTDALLALVATTGEAHHILIAKRPRLHWRVVKALLKSPHDSVLTALADNHDLELDGEDQAALARLAGDRPGLRAAILARPALVRARALLDAPEAPAHGFNNLRLLRLLQAGETERFVRDAARRLKRDPLALNAAVAAQSAVPFALLCCALGFDRAVFLNLLPHWQKARPGQAVMNHAHRPMVLSVFDQPPESALNRLTALIK